MISLRLHHIGVAVKDIESHAETYVRRFGYHVCTKIIHDPAQTANVQFLRLAGDSSYLEFVAPDGPNSMLTNFVSKGGGLHHLCYVTPNIHNSCAALRNEGLIMVREPVPAVAFSGRPIAWLMGLDRLLVELVQLGGEGEL